MKQPDRRPSLRSNLRRVPVASRTEIDAQVAPLRADPSHSAVFLDIDGTLAAITIDPQRTHIAAATSQVLRRVVADYRLVGAVTGRRALDARRLVGLDIEYAGNHGMEQLSPGETAARLDPAVLAWRPAIRNFHATQCDTALLAAGVRVEDKDVVITLHWRGAANPARAERAARAAAEVGRNAGLRIQPGRGIVEIRPPIAIDKGSAVRRLLDGHPEVRHVIYAGDDCTDVDALRALSALKASGRLASVVRVGVASNETPLEIVANVDLMVRGPRGVRALLKRLESPQPVGGAGQPSARPGPGV